MLNLKQLQNKFIDHVISRETNEIALYIKHSTISQDARLQIYRQTIFENLYSALKITYPGIWKLIGEECARAVCYSFNKNKENLPLNGYIDDWGSKFPKFLSTLPALKNLKYLGDYARLEWLQHLSYCAADSYNYTIEELQNIPEEVIDTVQLSFNHATFFLKSEYSLDVIHELLEPAGAENINVNLNSSKSFIVITRSGWHVKTLWVSKDYFEFLTKLNEGKPLSIAVDETLKDNPEFEFPNALSFIFVEKLISSIKILGEAQCS